MASQTKKVTWAEDDTKRWMRCPPVIELVYDDKFGFLLSAYFQIDSKKTKMREKELMAIFNDILKENGVYGEYDSHKDALSRRMSIAEPGGEKAEAEEEKKDAPAEKDKGSGDAETPAPAEKEKD